MSNQNINKILTALKETPSFFDISQYLLSFSTVSNFELDNDFTNEGFDPKLHEMETASMDVLANLEKIALTGETDNNLLCTGHQ